MQSDTQTLSTPESSREGVAAVSIKGSVFTLPIVKIHSSELAAIKQTLHSHMAKSAGFFKDSPVVLDLSDLPEWLPDFTRLRQVLADMGLMAAALQNASENQIALARGAGIGNIATRSSNPSANASSASKDETATSQNAADAKGDNTRPDNSAANTSAAQNAAQNAAQKVTKGNAMHLIEPEFESQTMVYDQPIRGGQRLYARGGDLIQLAAVNPGGEIMADGNIHIYAPLRGRALAGVSGDENARIFCHNMQAELVAVAGNYRVFEDNIPADIKNKSVQVFLQDEQLIIRVIG